MESKRVLLIDSNHADFRAGKRVWAEAERRRLTKLAGLAVEQVTYHETAQRVVVETALGYHFSISTADYHRLIPE
jgi:hypothetical protein